MPQELKKLTEERLYVPRETMGPRTSWKSTPPQGPDQSPVNKADLNRRASAFFSTGWIGCLLVALGGLGGLIGYAFNESTVSLVREIDGVILLASAYLLLGGGYTSLFGFMGIHIVFKSKYSLIGVLLYISGSLFGLFITRNFHLVGTTGWFFLGGSLIEKRDTINKIIGLNSAIIMITGAMLALPYIQIVGMIPLMYIFLKLERAFKKGKTGLNSSTQSLGKAGTSKGPGVPRGPSTASSAPPSWISKRSPPTTPPKSPR